MIKFTENLTLKPLLFKCEISYFGFLDEDPRFQCQLEFCHSIHLPIQGVVQAGFLQESCPCRVHLNAGRYLSLVRPKTSRKPFVVP